MTKLYLIITALTCLAGGYFLYRFTGCLIDIRGKKQFHILLTAGYAMISMTVIQAGDAFNICAALVLGISLIFCCTRGLFAAKIAAAMIILPLILTLCYVQDNNLWINNLKHLIVSDGKPLTDLPVFYFYNIIFDGLNTFIYYLLYRFFKNRLTLVKIYMNSETWWYIIGIAAASFASFTAAVISPPAVYDLGSMGDNHMLQLPVMSWLIVGASALTNLCILLLMHPIIDSVRFRMQRQKDSLKEEYYELLEAQQKQTGKLKHDINNHFQMLQTYLNSNQYEKATQYLDHMISTVPAGGRCFCKDRALNAILNIRYEKLLSVCGNVHFNLDIRDDIGIEIFDLCTIFTNSIDNALDAVCKIDDFEKRSVVVKARCENNFFGYQVTNAKCNNIKISNGNIQSDKPEGKHGFGLDNIREITEKYNGKLTTTYTEDEFSLIVYINI